MKLENGLVSDDDLKFEREKQEREKSLAELEKQAAEEQEKKLREETQERFRKTERDHVELMKLKQGLLAADNADLKYEASVYAKPTGKKAIENFFYHYKWHFIAITFMTVFVTLFIVDMLTKVDPDIRVIYLPCNELNNHLDKLEDYFEEIADDINGDGKVYVEIIAIPVGVENYNPLNDVANQTKLAAESQSGATMIYISDEKSDDAFSPKGIYMTAERLEEVFTVNEGIVDQGFSLQFDILEEKLSLSGVAELPDDMYIAICEPVKVPGVSEKKFMETWNASKDFLENLVTDLYN
ncbi:MAG: hypothetical protein WC900_07740 [Oscillospiraceae bacterium]